jgi:small subunit ribosomal protein S21
MRHQEPRFSFPTVVARPDEPPEKMIRRFVRKVREDGILREFRERQYYVKPSVAKRRKMLRAQARRRVEEKAGERAKFWANVT